MKFDIKGSSEEKLKEAKSVGEEFANKYKMNGVVGIVFLGAISRGYFDKGSDIDISIFKSKGSRIPDKEVEYVDYKGFKIDYSIPEYEKSLESEWSMVARWAFSEFVIYYDPKGLIKKLLRQKVPLKKKERKELMIEGMTQSEWYINNLSKLWVRRGDLMSAFSQFYKGLDHFFDAIFAFNNKLIPDYKWKFYFVQRMNVLPGKFDDKIKKVLLTKELSLNELRRKRKAFMSLWEDYLPLVEKEVGMDFQEFERLV